MKQSDLNTKLEIDYKKSLKSKQWIMERNIWRIYCIKELDFDPTTKIFKFDEIKKEYDRIIIDYQSGYISPEVFTEINKRLKAHLTYERSRTFEYLVINNPNSEMWDVYFRYNILGTKEYPNSLKKHKHWKERINELSDKLRLKKIKSEKECLETVKRLFIAYKNEEFQEMMLYELTHVIKDSFGHQFYEVDDQLLSECINWFDEMAYYSIEEVITNHFDFFVELGISA